ncbi:MAG: DUF3179 domain-containing protein [Bacteroidetes bacterium]|nr:DUF3179 domain-containing protein [Bacteroidota bacterium]
MTRLLVLFVLLTSTALSAQLNNPHNLPYTWRTDTTKKMEELSELTMATQKDQLHTLDYPKFIHRKDKAFHFYEHEPVIAIQFGGRAKAYPLSLLTLFELSNDTLGGKHLMITFCPMCNAAIVYNREVKVKGKAEKQLLHFGVSGLLQHNDMVMYDKQTESWWEQMMGSAIVGELTGTNLEMMPAWLISVKEYYERFPDGEILSPENMPLLVDKKHHRPFHHLNHDTKTMDTAFYIPEKVDPRLPPLERVLDIHSADHTTIYPFTELAHQPVINEVLDNMHYSIFYHGETVSVLDEDKLSRSRHIGTAVAYRTDIAGVNYTFHKSGHWFKDDQTGSLWDITGFCREGSMKGKQLYLLPQSNHFAFAYLAFFPDCMIYSSEKHKNHHK